MIKKAMKPAPRGAGEVSTPPFHDETRWRDLLKSVGTLQDASRIAGVTDDQIAKWRDGKVKASLPGAAALCSSAGYSLDWLATGEGSKVRYSANRPVPFDPAVAQMAAEAVDFMDVGMRKRKRKPWSEEERQVMLDRVYRWFMSDGEG